MNLPQVNFAKTLQHWGRELPNAPAVALGTQALYTYRALSLRVARLAKGFAQTGLKPGDRVAIILPNCPAYFECLLACWHCACIPVPINVRLHARELTYVLENCAASLCVTSTATASESLAASCRFLAIDSQEYLSLFDNDELPLASTCAHDVAWLFYTSGTTGLPKGAKLSYQNLWSMCECYFNDVDTKAPWSSILHPAPLSHGSGLYALAHLSKASCQVVPESGGFDPAEIFELIRAWPNCVFFAAPTMIRRLTQYHEDVDIANLKAIIFGGAPMYLEDVKAYIERFGPRLAQLYGQGESPMTITAMNSQTFADTAHPRWQQRIASAGTAQSLVEVKTLDQHGLPTGFDMTGEVTVKGPSVMLGYWDSPDATAKAIKNQCLWTGDLGSLDSDGFLTLKDRSKDLIISGGSNIYPREVEEVLLQHSAISEVSVIGRPDREWGELVVAYVVLADSSLPSTSESIVSLASEIVERLDSFCLDHIARFKRPRVYRQIAELPKSNYGKILKTTIREIEADLNDQQI